MTVVSKGRDQGRYKRLLMEEGFFGHVVVGDDVAVEVEWIRDQARAFLGIADLRLVARVVGRTGTGGSLLGGRVKNRPRGRLGGEGWRWSVGWRWWEGEVGALVGVQAFVSLRWRSGRKGRVGCRCEPRASHDQFPEPLDGNSLLWVTLEDETQNGIKFWRQWQD